MASEVKTNKISPSTSTTVTLGDASDVFQLPASAEIDIASGATLDVNGTIDITGATATGFPSSGFDSVQVFTASGTYTVPAGITKQLVYVTGSGGGGATTNTSYGATSGGGGGTVIKKLALAAASTVTVVIGAAGAIGTIGNVSTFTTASGTSFTALTGPAGQAGKLNDRNDAATLPTGGDLNIAGGAGEGGAGGSSFWGGGGPSSWGTVRTSLPGIAFGSGGGTGSSSASYHTGSVGAAGVVFVLEFK